LPKSYGSLGGTFPLQCCKFFSPLF
jgi:hypothetical protein